MSNRAEPYNATEQVVVGYLREIMPDIGAGDDPVRFLVASHAAFRAENQRLTQETQETQEMRMQAISDFGELQRAVEENQRLKEAVERVLHQCDLREKAEGKFGYECIETIRKALEHRPEGVNE